MMGLPTPPAHRIYTAIPSAHRQWPAHGDEMCIWAPVGMVALVHAWTQGKHLDESPSLLPAPTCHTHTYATYPYAHTNGGIHSQ